jgi:hypothetical protein
MIPVTGFTAFIHPGTIADSLCVRQ